MPILCRDLSEYGVVLVGPDRVEYFRYLEDIERRLHERPNGSPPLGAGSDDEVLQVISTHDTTNTVILINQAPRAIAAISYIWVTRGLHDRPVPNSMMISTNPSVLLPFGMTASNLSFEHYWNRIFSGSKRLLNFQLGLLGDNTDVRPPRKEEI